MSRFIVCIVTQYFQKAKQRYLPRKVWRQKNLRSFQVFKIHLLFSCPATVSRSYNLKP